MRKIIFPVVMLWLISCGEKPAINDTAKLNALAEQYVRLGLTIGQYDADFVDAYYGPDSLKPTTAPDAVFPKDSLLAAVANLSNTLNAFDSTGNDTLAKRATWIQAQLKAFERRIKIFAGETATFDEESKDLYGVVAPVYDSVHYKQIIAKLDSLLPGKGSSTGLGEEHLKTLEDSVRKFNSASFAKTTQPRSAANSNHLARPGSARLARRTCRTPRRRRSDGRPASGSVSSCSRC